MTQQVPEAEPQLDGVRNFRDLGGLPAADGRRVRRGVLFRSGHLAHATAEDAAFLTSLGLHTVFDFRNAADQALDGHDVELPGVRSVNIPMTDPADGAEFWAMVREGAVDELRTALSDGRAADRMAATYRQLVVGRTAELGRVLRELAGDGVPALLHCAAGKDRAGVAVAVVLSALGVERDTVEADYLASNAAHRRYRVHRSSTAPDARSAEVMELIGPLFDARAEYLATAFDAMETGWGGTRAYLAEGLGLTSATLGRLRDRLLE